MESRLNPADIYRWFDIFHPTGKLAEIRVMKGRDTWSGYFHSADKIVEQLTDRPELLEGNVYYIVNAINESCSGRTQYNKFLVSKTTTSDKDVAARTWVFIDIDVKKPADVNSTDEEKAHAIAVTRKVVHFLLEQGFREPVVIDSSNGAHILLKCELLNTEDNTNLVKNFIAALKLMFDDEVVEIDPAIYNAARLAKLPGTMSGKGRKDDPQRPQRWCKFLKVPKEILPTDKAYFEKVAGILPEPPQRSSYNGNYDREKFDLKEFIQKYNIPVKQEVHAAGGTRYILDHCLFNEQHKGKDAMIFQYDNGAIQYKCLHASCSQYRWRDVRLLYEPDAYSNRQDVADFAYKQRMRGLERKPFVPQTESEEKGPIWLSLDEIPTLNPDDVESIATGIKDLDYKIFGGTVVGQLSVMTGRPASGKSTLLNTVLLSSIQQGYPTALFSGELSDQLLKSWITLPAAGRSYVKPSLKRNDSWFVPKEIEDKVLKWLKGKLFVHNNKYGNKWGQLKEDILQIIERGAKNIILDNLMTLSLDYETESQKYAAQKTFIEDLSKLVKEKKVHVWLVAHPRKQTGLLRYDDIAGASDIGNLADNIFIVHRINQDFENQAKQFFNKHKVDEIHLAGYTNVVEIAKNRVPGIYIGDLVGVFYEPESKRMKNDKAEVIQYGWDESPAPSVAAPPDTQNLWYNKEQDDGLDF